MYRFGRPAFDQVRRDAAGLLRATEGSAVLEFSIILPLLVVFVVGIYDFSSAFNQKQKVEQAAQEGAVFAGAQPTSDITVDNPDSLQPVVYAVFKSLADSGVLQLANQGGTCSLSPFPTPQHAGLTWTYTILGCSGSPPDANPGCMGDPSDKLWIVINRGVPGGGTLPVPLETSVTVSYDYHWRFNSAIQLLFPGAGYSAKTCISEASTVQNQM
jgi:hypothetical protein